MGIVVINHVSLDGVMQAPGRVDEDPRDGFAAGGWADVGSTGSDEVVGAAMGQVMGPAFSWLFGRRTYDDMLGHWNAAGGAFKDGLNHVEKLVVSRGPGASLPWPNSRLVTGDVPEELRAAVRDSPGNLVIMGSGVLVRSLLPVGLVDTLLLIQHPVVLGAGRKLFGDGVSARFALQDVTRSSSGLAVARYDRT